MKRFVVLTLALAAAGLDGCVAVPVADPAAVYVAPPPVVRPYHYGYYGHDRFDRDDRGEHRWR